MQQVSRLTQVLFIIIIIQYYLLFLRYYFLLFWESLHLRGIYVFHYNINRCIIMFRSRLSQIDYGILFLQKNKFQKSEMEGNHYPVFTIHRRAAGLQDQWSSYQISGMPVKWGATAIRYALSKYPEFIQCNRRAAGCRKQFCLSDRYYQNLHKNIKAP